ncbi:MAG: hypothetical protein NC177_00995 [Ruminococcus flavefaciens]|nr:hypothetical protein [Ruminococcus flavefaciens]
MSWSLDLIRTKTNTEPYHEEKDEDIIPFTKDEIIKTLSEISGIIDILIEESEIISVEDDEIDMDSFFIVHVSGKNWSIEFHFCNWCEYSEKDMKYDTIELQVRGNTEPKEFLSLLTGKLNARLFDMSAGKFWTGDNLGFSDWKNLCDRIHNNFSGGKL